MFYDQMGAEQAAFDVEVLGTFELGNCIEEDVKRRLLKMGFTVERDQESIDFNVMDQLLWRGHHDGIVSHYQYSGRWLVDIKSCHPNIFQQLPEDPIQCGKFVADASRFPWLMKYIGQLQGYMSGIAQNGLPSEQVDGSMILFSNKSNTMMKRAIVEDSKSYEVELVNRCLIVREAVKTGTEPDFVANPEICRMCNYRDVSCFPVVSIDSSLIIDPDKNKDILDLMGNYSTDKAAWAAFKKRDELIKERMKRLEVGMYTIASGGTVKVSENKNGVKSVKIVTEDDEDEQ
jgi:hypothetical protein